MEEAAQQGLGGFLLLGDVADLLVEAGRQPALSLAMELRVVVVGFGAFAERDQDAAACFEEGQIVVDGTIFAFEDIVCQIMSGRNASGVLINVEVGVQVRMELRPGNPQASAVNGNVTAKPFCE